MGFDGVEFAFAIAGDTSGFGFTFGAETFGDLQAFADHALIDAGEDVFVVVDAFEADVEEFDAVFAQFWFGAFFHLGFDGFASDSDFWEGADFGAGALFRGFDGCLDGFVDFWDAGFVGADDFDEFVTSDGVAGFAAEDVFKTGFGAASVAEADEEQFGVGDAPACEGAEADVGFVFGGDFDGLTVPVEETFFQSVDGLHRGFEFEARSGDGVADDFAKLGNDDVFCFVDDVEATTQDGDEE